MTSEIVSVNNLGIEFSVGDIQPKKIRLKLGSGLGIQPDGTIINTALSSNPILNVNVEQKLGVVGYVNVNSNGTIASKFPDSITAIRINTGDYLLTPPIGALVGTPSVIESTLTEDDVVIHKSDFICTNIHIAEQDNGGARGIDRDRAFSVVWLGLKDTITNITLN